MHAKQSKTEEETKVSVDPVSTIASNSKSSYLSRTRGRASQVEVATSEIIGRPLLSGKCFKSLKNPCNHEANAALRSGGMGFLAAGPDSVLFCE